VIFVGMDVNAKQPAKQLASLRWIVGHWWLIEEVGFMSETLDFDDDIDGIDESEDEPTETFKAVANLQRHDVRRKIEEMMERRRLREEFGELEF